MRTISKALSLFNIKPDNNQKWLLLSSALSMLLITYAHPTIIKEIATNLPAEWLAFQSLSVSLSALLIGMIWKGCVREYAIRFFLILALTESICGCFLGLFLCFIHYDVWIFAVASLVYSSLVSTFVGKCIMVFKSKLWIERDREIYDNNVDIVIGIVCVVGYLFAIIGSPSLQVSLFIWAICCIIDDIGWIIVYSKNRKRLIIDNKNDKS